MRLLFHLRGLLLLAGLLGLLPLAHASHIMGGDIAYRPLAPTAAGVPRYHVTVRLFNNAPPSAFDQREISLLATQGNCASPTANSFRVDNIPRSLRTPGTWADCTTTLATYFAELYETDVALLPGQWTLAVVGENRAGGILNLGSGASSSYVFYINTTLDNTLTAQNASPVFESNALPILIGAGQPPFSFSAFDADGDSLAYAFTLVQNFPGGLPASTPPATCPTPVTGTLSPHFTIQPASGVLTPTATSRTLTGRFVMAARVSEYRFFGGQWQLLGYATRDITYLVLAGSNQPPTFTTAAVDGGPTQSPDLPVRTRPGQQVQMTLTATDPDAGQLLRFSSGATTVVPGLSLTTLSPTQAQLSWQVPASLRPGIYRVPVAVSDNGCPYSASEDRTLTFVVGILPLGLQAGTVALASAWPTPFGEQVQFAAPAGQPVLVVDALGRQVATLLAGPDGLVRWVPASALAPGLYLARTPTGAPLARLLRAE